MPLTRREAGDPGPAGLALIELGVQFIQLDREAHDVRLEEIAPVDRAGVIAEYLRRGEQRSGAQAAAKQARFYFGLDPNPSFDEIKAIVDYYPVFRIVYER